MRRLALVVLTSSLLSAVLVVGSAGKSQAFADGPQGGGGTGIGWQYSESANGYYRPPQSSGGGGGGGGPGDGDDGVGEHPRRRPGVSGRRPGVRLRG